MNAIFNYVQNKMTDKRKHKDLKMSPCKKELNKFSDMSIKKNARMDVEEEGFWNFDQSKQQKGVFKTKK